MDRDKPDPIRAAILTLLTARGPGKTICPSEAARVVGGEAWRDAMPGVHGAVDALVAEGAVVLSWKGVGIAEREGAYRIALATRRDGRARAG